jgi:hypothetical protein
LVAAKQFLQLALQHTGEVGPWVINADGHPAYGTAIDELKETGDLGRRCRCRPSPHMNNVLEQDHRFNSVLYRPSRAGWERRGCWSRSIGCNFLARRDEKCGKSIRFTAKNDIEIPENDWNRECRKAQTMVLRLQSLLAPKEV